MLELEIGADTVCARHLEDVIHMVDAGRGYDRHGHHRDLVLPQHLDGADDACLRSRMPLAIMYLLGPIEGHAHQVERSDVVDPFSDQPAVRIQ